LKAAASTSVGIELNDGSVLKGGGLIGVTGNTGNGVHMLGNNSNVENFYVSNIGGDGFRVGALSNGGNTNSWSIKSATAASCTGHGFHIHHATTAAGADANAGILEKCFATSNLGDGIHLGHAFWNTLNTCLTEGNSGWGLYLSGTINNGYPENRYTTVIGGDYAEGNTLGQVYSAGYRCAFFIADPASMPTSAGLESCGFSGYTSSTVYGLTVSAGTINAANSSLKLAAAPNSADANTLDAYAEGTWIPTGNSLSFTSASGTYTRVGRLVTLTFSVVIPVTADAANNFQLTSLPFNSNVSAGVAIGENSGGAATVMTFKVQGTTNIIYAVSTAGAVLKNADLSGKTLVGTTTYIV
jgi:hypothetical protein